MVAPLLSVTTLVAGFVVFVIVALLVLSAVVLH
jgi:hypothetical protein